MSDCQMMVGVAEHVRGTNPLKNEHASLREGMQVADCCRRESRFDLAGEVLDMIESFPLSLTDSTIRTATTEIRRRCSRKDTSGAVIEVVPLPPGSTGQSPEQRDLDAAMLKAPNFFVKGWNFGKHMAWAAWHRFPQADEKTIKQRLSICEDCEHRENEHCKLCGCKCELRNHLMNKLAHAGSECPVGKWKAVEGKRTKKGSKK